MKTKQFEKRVFLLFAFLLCMFVFVMTPSADESSSLDDEISDNTTVKKYQQQISELESKIAEQKEQVAEAEDEIERFAEEKQYYDDLLELYSQLKAANEALIEEIEAELADLEVQIEEQQAVCDELYEEIKERIRVSYETGDTSYIEMIFEADSIFDFLIGLDYSISIMQYDSRKMAEYETAKEELASKLEAQQARQAELEATNAEYEASIASYDATSAEMEQRVAELQASISDSEALIAANEAALEEASDGLSSFIDDYIAQHGATAVSETTTEETTTETTTERETTTAETTTEPETTTTAETTAEAEDTTGESDDTTSEDETTEETTGVTDETTEETTESSSSGGTSSSTDFIWPLPTQYTTITSYFGARSDPFTGAAANHGAIDIYAPKGTDIYAAASGTVILAQSYSTYGNCVIIDHGNGLFTLYAHASKINVSVGDTVTQGQVIAQVGMTGRATGYHLHFEVRVGSTRVDPLDYVSIP